MMNTVAIPKPPKLSDYLYGTQLIAGLGMATVIADFDFETYSPAGYSWDAEKNKFKPPHGASTCGLETVGLAQYAEHPDAEVLCLAYNLKDGTGPKLWKPGDALPEDLFNHLRSGLLLESWNIGFEYWIWSNVCVSKYGFPELPTAQLRCAMAKSQASALPGALGKAAHALDSKNKKAEVGKDLIKLFCFPKNEMTRVLPIDQPDKFVQLCDYCIQDIATEGELSLKIPDLTDSELEFWQCDQAINRRGVALDIETVLGAIRIIEETSEELTYELQALTNFTVTTSNQLKKMASWVNEQAPELCITKMGSARIKELLATPNLPESVKRVLEIRQFLGSASVKKLYAMKNQLSREGRLHNLFKYHATRTGRAAGYGPQPQNLPNKGPTDLNGIEWSQESVELVTSILRTGSLSDLKQRYESPIEAVSGCLRGLFIAGPGQVLISSDYSAIEAVVLAMLAGEEWRIEVFKTHGMIYEMSASKITGVPFEDFVKYKNETGQHHPHRKTIGKVAELASGYQGWIGAWMQFGAGKFFTEPEIKNAILAWRKASPKIVEFWGGQKQGWSRKLYGVEGNVINAIQSPGVEFNYRGLVFLVKAEVLYIKLLSGRLLTYRSPKLEPSIRRADEFLITFMGWNTNRNKGAVGWVRMSTYGGQLVENIVQATARDILANAIIRLERAGLPVVLHVHDEIVCEVPDDGLAELRLRSLEAHMNTMPEWAKGWPLKAAGGWIGKRFRK